MVIEVQRTKENLQELNWEFDKTKSALSNLQKDVLDTKEKSEIKFDKNSQEQPVELGETQRSGDIESYKEIPQELQYYREAWERNINVIGKIGLGNMKKIKAAVDSLPVSVNKQTDWSMMIEFTIWDKKYKILNSNLSKYTDEHYKSSYLCNITLEEKSDVKWIWMRWDDVDKRENEKLKTYVKKQQSKWFHIVEVEEMLSILNELWRYAKLTEPRAEVAMLMYLTGMEWNYKLNVWDCKKEERKDKPQSYTMYWLSCSAIDWNPLDIYSYSSDGDYPDFYYADNHANLIMIEN